MIDVHHLTTKYHGTPYGDGGEAGPSAQYLTDIAAEASGLHPGQELHVVCDGDKIAVAACGADGVPYCAYDPDLDESIQDNFGQSIHEHYNDLVDCT